jgi:hypothetical protein
LVDDEITEHVSHSEDVDARSWLSNMIATLKCDDQVRVFITLWAIWHARRKAIHEQLYQSPLSVHCFVENFIADLKQGEEKEKRNQGGRREQHIPAWVPPPPGMIKINVDAAVGKNSGRGTVAAVARNDSGLFWGASAVVFPGRTVAETLEALACREAIALARDLDARHSSGMCGERLPECYQKYGGGNDG